MATPLLSTKLYIPPLRRSLVRRTRLLERLNRGLHRKLTLVSAPAGFGKTTLLVEWIHELKRETSPPVRVAWVSLDSGDDDPARFVAYLSAAIRQAGEGLDQAGGDSLEAAGALALEPHLVTLINRVAARPHTLLLVLDDYHLITSQVIHDALAFLLDHQAENMHLVLATRGDPPLPLARLRARGELTELRQSDLRFTVEETTTFLNDVASLDLLPKDVAALEARTEGWIAGLRMASLAAQGWRADGAGDLSGFVQAFTGSHRFVLDYLMEEVLDQQSPTIQEFLLKTSILEHLSGPLCDAVLDEGQSTVDEPGTAPVQGPLSEGQAILEYLEEHNLFILPLDDERRWYRYHRLFSDLLRKRLRQTAPALMPALHRRASDWHEEQGLTAAAIEHALAAQDHERAATLIEEGVEAILMRSEVSTFLRWVERLPNEVLRTHPTLCFYHAWALLMSGRSLEVVEGRLEDIACVQEGADLGEVMPGRVAALRSYSMLFRADMERAAEWGRQALETLPESEQFLRSIMSWILSMVHLADGSLQDGSQELQEVARLGQEIGNPLIAVTALCHRARLQARRGRLHRARETLEQALQLATDGLGRRLPIASEPLFGLGELWREWNDLEAATDCFVQGIELAMQWSETAAFDAYGPLARIKAAQGDIKGAREAIEMARKLADKSEATEVDDLVADLLLGSFMVLQGDVEGATRWAESRGLVPGSSKTPLPDPDQGLALIRDRLQKYEQEVLARLFILQDRATEALDLLEPLLAQARQLDRIDLTIDIQILRALAFQAEGQEEQAMTALDEALNLAEPGGFVRIFLDEGPAMARLLRQAASRGIAPTYAVKLLAEFDGSDLEEPQSGLRHPQPQPLIEPLSEREMEVLRLLASGMSNPEIAEHLYIAVSTVRSHCKSIYAKLNVHKRWDAVHRAQELGLI